MVHYTDIDLTGSEAVCSSYLIGRENEKATEVLRLILPPKYLNCKFTFDFKLEDGSLYSSNPFNYNETGKIEYTLPQNVMRKGILVIGIRAEDAARGYVKRIFERSFICTENITFPKEGTDEVIERITEKVNQLEDEIASIRPDWNENDPNSHNYIDNRTHWEDKIVTVTEHTVEWLEETPPFSPQNWDCINLGVSLEEGVEYTLIADGQTITGTPTKIELDVGYIQKHLVIGNLSYLNGLMPSGETYEDNGFPMLLDFATEYIEVPSSFNLVLTHQDYFGSDITFSLGQEASEYHTLPVDYMPESVKDAVENKHAHGNRNVLDSITNQTLTDVVSNSQSRHTHGNKATLDELHCDDLETSESEISPGGMGDPYRELLAFRGQYLRRINDGGVIQGAEEVMVNGRKYIRLKIYYDPTTNLYDMIEIGQNVRPRFIDIPIESAQDSTIIDGGVTLNGTEIDFGISELEADSHTHTNKAVLDQLAFASIGGTSLLTYDNRLTGLPPIRNENDPFTGAITPHVLHRFGNGLANPISSLTITSLSTSNAHAGLAAEYLIEFVTGATAPTVTFPASVEWADELTVEANKHYQISILDNIALWCAVDVEAVNE